MAPPPAPAGRLQPPKPWLTGTVTIPGARAVAAAQMPQSPDRKAEGTPSKAAVSAFTVNSDASAPLIVSRMILPLKLCASGLLSVPAAS